MKKSKKMSKKNIEQRFQSRRQFLIGSGHFCLTLPPLLSLMPRSVFAQVAGQRVVRYVSCLGMLGIDYHQWTPSDQPDLLPVAGVNDVWYKALSNFNGPVSRVVDSSFQDLYPYMNIISGMSLTGGLYQGHNTSVLSGTHSGGRDPVYGKSIDVIIEQSPNVYRPNDVVHKKAIRMHDGSHVEPFSFDRLANGSMAISQQLQGDVALFNALMSGLTNGGVIGPSQAQTNKETVVDQVLNDIRALDNHKRISKSDRELLDRYISGISDLEKKVKANNTLPPSCNQPNINFQVTRNGNYWHFPRGTGGGSWGVSSVDAMFDNYIEMFKIAAMCDQTRVFHWGSNTWDYALVAGGTAGGLHHEAPGSDTQATRQQYFVKKVADLARAFRDTPDPINGGNLLDNSIMFYTNELGAWTTSHNIWNIPTISFGNGGGKISSGNFIDCRQRPLNLHNGYFPGRPYKQFLQAVMASMGVTKAEYMQFGDGNGFGEFKDTVNQFGFNSRLFDRYANEHNDPLPFFFTG